MWAQGGATVCVEKYRDGNDEAGVSCTVFSKHAQGHGEIRDALFTGRASEQGTVTGKEQATHSLSCLDIIRTSCQ